MVIGDLPLAVHNLIFAIINLASLLLFVYVVLDLARNFVRDLPPFVTTLHEALAKLWEPVLRPIRNALPALGGLDFSPVIVLLALQFIGWLLA